MDKYTVFTNNSIVVEFLENKGLPMEIKWVAASAVEVLSAAKTAARQGAIVLSNPLAGVRSASPLFSPSNLPPTPGRGAAQKISSINPYLTILVSPVMETVDFSSVQRIDEALGLYKKNARLRFLAHNDDAIKAFQTSDLEIIIATLAHLANITKK
ncbi:MAG: hypothetical protein FWB91_05655 [Defluviitaleaceae bacterium]|nr:hypothetical protein [Defluviitaleaceae bacterium]